MDSIFSDWPGGSLESALRLGGLVLVVYALILWFSAIIWTYSDIRNRTTDQFSQLVAVLLVAVFNLPGLVVYLVIRPQTTMADAYERSLESESLLHELQLTANSCQTCQRPIDDDFNICPHCRTVLREPCRNCERSVRTSWLACPYCATDRPQPRPVEAGPGLPERPARTRQTYAEEEPARQPRTEPLARPSRPVQSRQTATRLADARQDEAVRDEANYAGAEDAGPGYATADADRADAADDGGRGLPPRPPRPSQRARSSRPTLPREG